MVTQQDIVDVLDKQMLEGMGVLLTEEEQQKIEKNETAISVFHPRDGTMEQDFTTYGYMIMQMVVAHGGRCAERIVFGNNFTDSGKDDLEKITKNLCLNSVTSTYDTCLNSNVFPFSASI
ncbi:hypothetical protein ACLOJK_020086 [Asimina triloba]